MAQICLDFLDFDEDDLPRVCASCGARTTFYKPKTFSWHPPWVMVTILAGLLLYVIIALVLTKRASIRLPLCDSHRWHFGGRTLLIFGVLAALVLFLIVGLVLIDERTNPDAPGYVALVFAAGMLGWLVMIVVLNLTMIRAQEITDRSITLTGVSQAFVDAVEDDLDRVRSRSRRRYDDDDEEDDDDYPRRRRSRSRARDEDDEPPRRRPAARDDAYTDRDERRPRRSQREDDEDDR